ncbi:MAG: 2Fe-2S iron-sulfur cluster-binding protein [Vicinamibacterales bacterium]|nr:2Fe-2S iron-sulfur cluster-binding protein [Vicinamibacterales bacterium]
MTTALESFLTQHDSATWARAFDSLLPAIHEVERNATRIWLRFYPLALADAVAQAEDVRKLETTLRLDGNYRLVDQIDTSHWFFYGHRFWPHVKTAIIARATSNTAAADLTGAIRDIAKEAAAAGRTDESLAMGIAAVGVMTLRQVGLLRFSTAPGAQPSPAGLLRKQPDTILAARKRDDGQGLMGWMRGPENAQYSVTFDETRSDGRFTAIKQTPLTNGSARDTRDYSSGPRRCHEGAVPVECRTASCGTCWVGVLAGAEKLSDVEGQEAKLLKDCGYLTSTEPKPVIRLACKAMTSGNVTIVIPTWNGFLAKGGLRGL